MRCEVSENVMPSYMCSWDLTCDNQTFGHNEVFSDANISNLPLHFVSFFDSKTTSDDGNGPDELFHSSALCSALHKQTC